MIRRQFKADIGRWPRQVCFVPRSVNSSYSITASAVGSSDGGMVRPSALAVLRSLCPLYPPKADMCSATRDVRFGPKAGIGLLVSAVRQERAFD